MASETSALQSRIGGRDFTQNDPGRGLSARKDAVRRARRRGSQRRGGTTTSTACSLSGGTDSSTIAGMLTRAVAVPGEADSIGFDAAGYDEMEYARLAARHFGLAHDEYY